MSQTDDAGTRARVLELIVEKGPVSAAQLARVLDLTSAAVRRHLTALDAARWSVTPMMNRAPRCRCTRW